MGELSVEGQSWRSMTLLISLAIVGCSASSPPPAPEPAPPPVAARPSLSAPDSALQQAAVAETFDPTKWAPPETGPSPIAVAVLATLPNPGAIALPSDLPRPLSSTGQTSPNEAWQRGSSGTCFEVQIGASGDLRRAQDLSQTAASRLGSESRVVESGSLYRIRVGGCLTETQALQLRDRARTSGYADAFLVNPVD